MNIFVLFEISTQKQNSWHLTHSKTIFNQLNYQPKNRNYCFSSGLAQLLQREITETSTNLICPVDIVRTKTHLKVILTCCFVWLSRIINKEQQISSVWNMKIYLVMYANRLQLPKFIKQFSSSSNWNLKYEDETLPLEGPCSTVYCFVLAVLCLRY